MYKPGKVHKQDRRVVLNDYTSSYRVLLDTVSKPILYESRLKAIAVAAYKWYVNEDPEYAMLDRLTQPYDLGGRDLGMLNSRKWTLCPVASKALLTK